MASKTIIRVGNPDLHDNQRTTITTDIAAGATALPVSSTTGFGAISGATDYYYVVIGNYGEETTEIVLVNNTVTGTSFPCTATKYSHSASDPVTYIQYNQVKFHGRTVTGGANNLLATKDIDPTQQFTIFETTSTTYSIFVTTYYRAATTAEESGSSDEITTYTFSFNSARKIIEAGLRKALTRADENPDASLGWNTLIDLMNEGLNEIITRKKKWQVLHTISDPVVTVPGTAYIDKPVDTSIIEFLTVDGNKIDYITKTRYNQYTLGRSTQQGTPEFYTIKNDQIYFYPTPSSVNNIVFEYYATPAEITSLADTVKKEFAMILVYFIAAQAAYIRNNEKRGTLMEAKFQQTLALQMEDIEGWEQAGESSQVEHTSIYGQFYGDGLGD